MLLGYQDLGPGAAPPSDRAWTSGRRSSSRGAWPRASGPSGSASCSCPDLTDDPEDVAQIARFAAGLGNVERVDVLPFHQMGRFKWEKLGINYTLDQFEPPSNDLIERTLAIYRAEGLKAYSRTGQMSAN